MFVRYVGRHHRECALLLCVCVYMWIFVASRERQMLDDDVRNGRFIQLRASMMHSNLLAGRVSGCGRLHSPSAWKWMTHPRQQTKGNVPQPRIAAGPGRWAVRSLPVQKHKAFRCNTVAGHVCEWIRRRQTTGQTGWGVSGSAGCGWVCSLTIVDK